MYIFKTVHWLLRMIVTSAIGALNLNPRNTTYSDDEEHVVFLGDDKPVRIKTQSGPKKSKSNKQKQLHKGN